MDEGKEAQTAHAQQIETLQALCAMRERDLERTRMELAAGRKRSRYALGAVVLLGSAATVWMLFPAVQAIIRGRVIACPRLSTLDCRLLGPGELEYWMVLGTQSLLGLLFLAATVAALLGLRVLSRPAPVLQAMRASLQRLEEQLEVLQRGVRVR